MSSLRLAVEDRKADAVAHLAEARSQNTGPAFWGNILKIRAAASVQLPFLYIPDEISYLLSIPIVVEGMLNIEPDRGSIFLV